MYIQLLARQDGTDQPFSSTIIPTAIGEEFDWIVVATLAPAGTVNTNLPVDPNGMQQIGTWQASTATPTTNDGLNGMLFSLFGSPTSPTQVSFQHSGYIGAGGKNSIDQNVYDGITTKSGASNNTDINGNSSFTGGVHTISYAYTTSAVTQSPSGHFIPQSVAQSASGYALFQNYGQGPGANSGNVLARSPGNTNNDLANILVVPGTTGSYLGVDPAIVNTAGTNQSPISMVLESGSNFGGATYNNMGTGDANGVDSTFKITSMGAGNSTVSVNAFDMNPGNPGGSFDATQSFLNIQYHDTAGNQVKPGNSGTFHDSAQTSADPVV